MKNSMDISGHAFSITTYIKISTIRDDIPELRGLQTIKYYNNNNNNNNNSNKNPLMVTVVKE